MNSNMAADDAAVAGAKCILVVEDEPLIRLVISDELREHGFEVVEACNADEAMVILASTTPDLILTDVQMPGSIDGADLLALVKASTPGVPVIIASGTWEPTVQQMEIASRIVPKPFSIDALVKAIQEELEIS